MNHNYPTLEELDNLVQEADAALRKVGIQYARMCNELDTCQKIRMLRDKGFEDDDLADAIIQVCAKCQCKP